ncbi:putative Ig domain-containing protein [Psychrobium sp. nBUS_13]|uniref:CBM96 family carbohydrate-binding protein n=1 Tax=Psychrobium sp. nBUS_13 TaxID=3395319 RepID=UPI003EBE9866
MVNNMHSTLLNECIETHRKVAKHLLKYTRHVLVCTFIGLALPTWAAQLFVAPNGVDDKSTHDGSIKQPWASLDYALGQISAGDTINIRAGQYYEKITRGNVSGSASQPIIIQAYQDEVVIFDGTIALNGQWTHHTGNIYKMQITTPIWQLFVDGEMMMNARWPNARFDDGSVYTRESWALGLDASTTNGHIDTDPSVHDLAATNIDASNAVIIANTRHFDTYTRKVTAHSAGTNVIEHETTPFFWGSKSYYYLQGALSLLDQNKEWHIDSKNTVYFWAEDGQKPSGNIRGRNQQFVINANNWNHVVIKGLNFFATTIELTASESVTIQDSHFNYGGASKRALGEVDAKASLLRLTNTVGAGNFVLRNIAITNSDSQAFQIKGDNTIVENSLFKNIDWAATQAYSPSASLVFHGNNTLFSRNTIVNAGTSETIATAINGSGTNSSIIAQYNDISRTGFAQSDGAQLQIRIDAQDGTAVHHNWLHDTPKYGFRFDAPIPPPRWGDNGFSHHNVVWNSGGANPKGDNNRHYNNLLFDNTNIDLIILDDTATNGDKSNEFTKTVNNVADSISGHRVDVAPVPGVVGANFNGVNHPQTISSLLRDPKNTDFRPAVNSVLVDAGEVISDPDYSHPSFGNAPDLGAYESGNENYWIPGRQLSNASHPIPHQSGSTSNISSDLMWRQAYKATAHNVYFGTVSGALDFKGQQTNNIFSPGPLTIGKTYFWRIDAITPQGTITGDEWHFMVDANPVKTTLGASADAYVDSAKPNTNKGSEKVLRLVTPESIGGTYEQRIAFLKFDIDVPGTIISATLRLYNDQGLKHKQVNVHLVDDSTWAEDLITWNNQPELGTQITKQDFNGNAWQTFDLSAATIENGVLSLALKRDALNSRRELVSREGVNQPELIIEYQAQAPIKGNSAPVFKSNTLHKATATQDLAYQSSIATDANDTEGDPMTFDKVSGPDWLNVAKDGALSGIATSSDQGENSFVVRVSDAEGGASTVTLVIRVAGASTDTDSDNSDTDSASDDNTGDGLDNSDDSDATGDTSADNNSDTDSASDANTGGGLDNSGDSDATGDASTDTDSDNSDTDSASDANTDSGSGEDADSNTNSDSGTHNGVDGTTNSNSNIDGSTDDGVANEAVSSGGSLDCLLVLLVILSLMLKLRDSKLSLDFCRLK